MAVGLAMKMAGAPIGLVAMANSRVDSWTTSDSDWFTTTTTQHVQGYAKPDWYVVTPEQFSPHGIKMESCIIKASDPLNCPVEQVVKSGVAWTQWSGGNLPVFEDPAGTEWQHSERGLSLLSMIVIVFVASLVMGPLAAQLGAANGSAGFLTTLLNAIPGVAPAAGTAAAEAVAAAGAASAAAAADLVATAEAALAAAAEGSAAAAEAATALEAAQAAQAVAATAQMAGTAGTALGGFTPLGAAATEAGFAGAAGALQGASLTDAVSGPYSGAKDSYSDPHIPTTEAGRHVYDGLKDAFDTPSIETSGIRAVSQGAYGVSCAPSKTMADCGGSSGVVPRPDGGVQTNMAQFWTDNGKPLTALNPFEAN